MNMGDPCRISNAMANFLIELATDPKLYAEFQQNKKAVLAREEFGLSEAEQEVLSTDNKAEIREALDNIQIMP
jgi:hypothetical protein